MAQTNSNDIDHQFLHRAAKVATETDDPKAIDDPRAAVGAVIVKGGKVVSESANRLPPKLRDIVENIDVHSTERSFIEHAERCAIFDAVIEGHDLFGSTMYCTRFPCIDCARSLVYFGVVRLVVGAGFRHEERWIDSQRAAYQLLRSCGVKIRFL